MSGLLDRFRAGDRQALARMLTHVDNQTELGREAVSTLTPHTGHAHIIGITGPPGAGKSTLANAMVHEFRKTGKTVSVLAIDPSSPFTGGATLGDRVRMLDLQDDDGVYLRSMASRGQIGGITLSAFGAVLLLDAFGFDVVIIETVGTGQDELDVARLADSVVVVQTPGMGDSIQAVKAGILEIADILVVNKADIPGAADVARDLRMEVRSRPHSDWRTPVLTVISTERSGVDQLLAELGKHREFVESRPGNAGRKVERILQHARMLAIRTFTDYVNSRFTPNQPIQDPEQIASEMVDQFTRERELNR